MSCAVINRQREDCHSRRPGTALQYGRGRVSWPPEPTDPGRVHGPRLRWPPPGSAVPAAPAVPPPGTSRGVPGTGLPRG
jgi:hypothetical protein